MFAFDPKLTFGNILEIAVIAISFVIFIIELRSKLAVLGVNYDVFIKRFEKLEIDVEKLAEVAIKIATQDQRLKSLETAIDTMAEELKSHMDSTNEFRHKIMELSARSEISMPSARIRKRK